MRDNAINSEQGKPARGGKLIQRDTTEIKYKLVGRGSENVHSRPGLPFSVYQIMQLLMLHILICRLGIKRRMGDGRKFSASRVCR